MPVLLKDEATPLCKAHLVSSALGGRRWTVQRTDVDNFFGSMFESDFADLRHKGHKPDALLVNAPLSKRMRPTLVVNGRPVEHYLASGPVPDHHTPFVVAGESGPVRLALKLHPTEMKALRRGKWRLEVAKDLRIPALASLLKAAHLTLFDMLGYSYALSPGGRFLGNFVLGEFFLANAGRPRADVAAAAVAYFREYATMMRPMPGSEKAFLGSADDGQVLVCVQKDVMWGIVVILRVGETLHAVLVPLFQEPTGSELFLKFLEGPDERLQARVAKFSGDRWDASRHVLELVWPKSGVLYPE